MYTERDINGRNRVRKAPLQHRPPNRNATYAKHYLIKKWEVDKGIALLGVTLASVEL